ncbi:MAG: hypothetical protein RI932_1167, partial [Pseudomonadota bacterium]
MRTVFQVVATMVAANAAVALAADAKAATSKIKAGAAATAADAKAKASEVKAGAKTQATDAKAAAQEAAAAAAKKVEEQKAASAAPTAPAAAPAAPAAAEAKEAVKDAMAAQPKDSAELAGTTKSLIIPESAVLPESVLRFRAIYAGAKSEKGYDGAGNKVENGVKISANIGTAVLEYGITEKISAQLLIPYRLDGKAEISSKEKFIEQNLRAPVTAQVDLQVNQLKSGLGALYTNNTSFPAPFTIPGTNYTVPANTGIKTYVDALRAQAISTALETTYEQFKKTTEDTKFQKGLGDIEIGAKYALSTVKEPWFDGVPLYTSVAAGVRLDSSNYTEAT